MWTDKQSALVRIGRFLQSANYRFVTATPRTHRRFAHRAGMAEDLRGIFGWNQPFYPDQLTPEVLRALAKADALTDDGSSRLRATVRFSSWHQNLLAHSGFPTDAPDAVFFGPDSYRFARFIAAELHRAGTSGRCLDLGCGTGIGALAATRLATRPVEVELVDINDSALAFAEVNFQLAGLPAPTVSHSDLFTERTGPFDLIMANPPYLNDALGRLYRHGGGATGEALSLRILEESLAHLAPAGRLLLYTGVAVTQGQDDVTQRARQLAEAGDWDVRCEEIDVDVFGEELEAEAYAATERIAVLGVVVKRVGKAPSGRSQAF